jgi:hypothetical protein
MVGTCPGKNWVRCFISHHPADILVAKPRGLEPKLAQNFKKATIMEYLDMVFTVIISSIIECVGSWRFGSKRRATRIQVANSLATVNGSSTSTSTSLAPLGIFNFFQSYIDIIEGLSLMHLRLRSSYYLDLLMITIDISLVIHDTYFRISLHSAYWSTLLVEYAVCNCTSLILRIHSLSACIFVRTNIICLIVLVTVARLLASSFLSLIKCHFRETNPPQRVNVLFITYSPRAFSSWPSQMHKYILRELLG